MCREGRLPLTDPLQTTGVRSTTTSALMFSPLIFINTCYLFANAGLDILENVVIVVLTTGHSDLDKGSIRFFSGERGCNMPPIVSHMAATQPTATPTKAPWKHCFKSVNVQKLEKSLVNYARSCCRFLWKNLILCLKNLILCFLSCVWKILSCEKILSCVWKILSCVLLVSNFGSFKITMTL